jgi:hypothetical protein
MLNQSHEFKDGVDFSSRDRHPLKIVTTDPIDSFSESRLEKCLSLQEFSSGKVYAI